MQTQEGTDGRHAGTGRQTEHTNINYKMAREKLEKEREQTEQINAQFR